MKHSEGFLKLVNDAKKRIREVSVAETQERMKANSAARLIDVREDNEWADDHAAGAIHLGKGIIERDIEAEVPDKSSGVNSLLRRRLPFRPGCGRSPEHGLHQRLFHGRWLEGVERLRRAHNLC